jgi:hypothetical protein
LKHIEFSIINNLMANNYFVALKKLNMVSHYNTKLLHGLSSLVALTELSLPADINVFDNFNISSLYNLRKLTMVNTNSESDKYYTYTFDIW